MAGAETPELARAAEAGGADLIEIGFPFSDPLADGPVIRRAAERALAAGMRTAECLENLRTIREQVGVPLVPMTYASLLEAYGWERFDDGCTRRRRRVAHRRRPARRRAPRAPPRAARRADVDRRADRARRGTDRRLALPRHRRGDDRRAQRALARARPTRGTDAHVSRTCRCTPASASRHRSRPRRPPSSRTASSSARPRSSPPRTGAAALERFVAQLRAALD